jgi:hypothetical protein
MSTRNLRLPDFILNFENIIIQKTVKKPEARWVNVFSEEFLGKNIQQLYATETLFGNWDGELLILAQDALPASSLKSVINSHTLKGESREKAWRHADKIQYGDRAGWKTNERIKYFLKLYAPSMQGVYGSATAHMLYDDGNESYSQDLRGYESTALQTHLIEVLKWVVNGMPNLRIILCLGSKAWNLVADASESKLKKDYQFLRDTNSYKNVRISDKAITIIPAYHPAARVGKKALEKNWQCLESLATKKTG